MRSTSQVDRGGLEADLATQYIDNQWWKDDTNTSIAEPDETDGAATRKNQSMRELNSRIRRRILDDIKANPSSKSNVSNAERNTQAAPTPKNVPMPQVATGDSIDDPLEKPIVVVEIPFSGNDVEIPLNWKLSDKQKLNYIGAWRRLEDVHQKSKNIVNPSESIAVPHDDVLSVLDSIFQSPGLKDRL